ncbi:MAG: hypothetical protein LUF02_00980 [Erysipelotrichaceae bacterium]|nr:hypothetical protein [Erysipelotrichaceae bacterium]
MIDKGAFVIDATTNIIFDKRYHICHSVCSSDKVDMLIIIMKPAYQLVLDG